MSSSVNLLFSNVRCFGMHQCEGEHRQASGSLHLSAHLLPSPPSVWLLKPSRWRHNGWQSRVVWTRTRSHFKTETECCVWQIVRWMFKHWNWFSNKSVRMVTDIVCEWGGHVERSQQGLHCHAFFFPLFDRLKKNKQEQDSVSRLIDKVCAGLEKGQLYVCI